MAETIESAQRTIMVADSSKCGRSAFAHIDRLDAVQVLITDSAPAGTGALPRRGLPLPSLAAVP
jgi:DeoR/GlpR family transcriptional regulator of sugar metabolism